MRTLEDIQSDVKEARSLYEQGKLSKRGVEKRLAALRAERRDIERRAAAAAAPVTDRKDGKYRALVEAMLQPRDITVNGTEAMEVIQELMKELQPKTPLLQGVRYYYSKGDTKIPVLSPTIAAPVSYGEGTKSVPDDMQAQLAPVVLDPKAYISELAVTYETLQKSAVNLDAELPAIFADAFWQGLHKQILTGNGAGNNMQGIFTAAASATGENKLTCATAGTVTIADVVSLATAVQERTDDAVIILSPAIYSLIMADATAGVADLYKEELIRDKRLEGLQVLLTPGAPKATSAGAVVAAAMRLEDYALGIADKLSIMPIHQPHDPATYYQAVLLADGKIPVAKNLWALVAAAAST
jgi:HK97 family phage major capsid protein